MRQRGGVRSPAGGRAGRGFVRSRSPRAQSLFVGGFFVVVFIGEVLAISERSVPAGGELLMTVAEGIYLG